MLLDELVAREKLDHALGEAQSNCGRDVRAVDSQAARDAVKAGRDLRAERDPGDDDVLVDVGADFLDRVENVRDQQASLSIEPDDRLYRNAGSGSRLGRGCEDDAAESLRGIGARNTIIEGAIGPEAENRDAEEVFRQVAAVLQERGDAQKRAIRPHERRGTGPESRCSLGISGKFVLAGVSEANRYDTVLTKGRVEVAIVLNQSNSPFPCRNGPAIVEISHRNHAPPGRGHPAKCRNPMRKPT